MVDTPSERGGIVISLGFAPEYGAGCHILHERGERCRRKTHDIAVLSIIAADEMRSLPRLDPLLHELLHHPV
jgi:hypothetical protein